MGRVPTSVLLYAFLLGASLACSDAKKRAEPREEESPLQVGAVSWVEISEEIEDRVTSEEFERLAGQALGKVEISRLGMGKVILNGKLDITDGQGALLLTGRITVAGLGEPIRAGVAATGTADTKESARRLLADALSDLAHAFKGLLDLVEADAKGLIRALHSPEPDEQILAIRLLGKKRVPQAVPALGRLLEDPREQVVEAAAQSLSMIGDERAVPLLIGAIRRNDLRSEVRAIEAMGRIGGKEAAAYLEMTSLGHEIPEVRRISEQMLQRIRNR